MGGIPYKEIQRKLAYFKNISKNLFLGRVEKISIKDKLYE